MFNWLHRIQLMVYCVFVQNIQKYLNIIASDTKQMHLKSYMSKLSSKSEALYYFFYLLDPYFYFNYIQNHILMQHMLCISLLSQKYECKLKKLIFIKFSLALILITQSL